MLAGILLTASVSADSAQLLLAAQMDQVLTQCPQGLPCYSLARHTLRQLLSTESRWLLAAPIQAPLADTPPHIPGAQRERPSAHSAWHADAGPGSHPLRDVASGSGGAEDAAQARQNVHHESRSSRLRRTASGAPRCAREATLLRPDLYDQASNPTPAGAAPAVACQS